MSHIVFNDYIIDDICLSKIGFSREYSRGNVFARPLSQNIYDLLSICYW